MATLQDQAIALRRLDYSETSQIVVFYTREHGKIRAIAKGIKRSTKTRFSTGLDILDIGFITVSRRIESSDSLSTLTEWKQSRSLSGLRESLHRLYGAEYAAEITAYLTEDWDHHDYLYDALIESLNTLNGAEEPMEALVRYQMSLLTAIGSMPVFNACVACRRTDQLTHFSSFEGGMICGRCLPKFNEKHPVSEPTLKVLQQLVPSSGAEGAFALLNYHIAHLMGKAPRLAQHLVSHGAKQLVRKSEQSIDRRNSGI